MTSFLFPGHPLLRNHACKVKEEEVSSPEIQKIIAEMIDLAGGERIDPAKRVLVGLAAPQIGYSKRVIIVDVGVDEDRKNMGEIKVYINPEIVFSSSEQVEGREGCFSVDGRVSGIVTRAQCIKITALDRYGNRITEEFSGMAARIVQHEIDHLDGIRFPERVGEHGTLHWVEDEQYPEYRQNWRTWKIRCPWTTWLAMRDGKVYQAPD